MKRFRSRETAPEIEVRKVLHAMGLRYRLHRKVPGRPRRTVDIAFPREEVAVFIDGCFWHGCPDHGKRPTTNAEWWNWKIDTTIARDRDTETALMEAGWTVVRCWEHEAPSEAAQRIALVLRNVRGKGATRRS